MPSVSVTFPGLDIREARLQLKRGGFPSVCSVVATPVSGFVANPGTLTWTDQSTGTIAFRDMLPVISYDDQRNYARKGNIVNRMPFLDRRWRWMKATVSGRFNPITSDWKPRLSDDDRITLSGLFELLFSTVGEIGYQLSNIPFVYPRVEWDNTSVSYAFDELCERANLALSLTVNDNIVIEPEGRGADPTVVTDRLTVYPFEWRENRPSRVDVVCNDTIFESDFALTPYVPDEDLVSRILDSEPSFSYQEDPWQWGGLDAEPQQRYHNYGYRWYKMLQFADQTLDAPIDLGGGTFTIENISQCLPLVKPNRGETFIDTGTGLPEQFPALIYGRRDANNAFTFAQDLSDTSSFDAGHTPIDWPYTDRWNLDLDRGLVDFHVPIYQLVTPEDDNSSATEFPNETYEAEMFMRCLHRIHDKGTGHPHQQVFSRATTYTGPPITVRIPEAFLYVKTFYENVGGVITRGDVQTNYSELEDYVNLYLDSLTDFTFISSNYDYAYIGLIPVSPSGRVAMVEFSYDSRKEGKGMNTRASRGYPFGRVRSHNRDYRTFEDTVHATFMRGGPTL